MKDTEAGYEYGFTDGYKQGYEDGRNDRSDIKSDVTNASNITDAYIEGFGHGQKNGMVECAAHGCMWCKARTEKEMRSSVSPVSD